MRIIQNKKKQKRIDHKEMIEEDYGWKIQRGHEWDAFEDALEYFGPEMLVEEFARAMGNEELRENLAFIFRMHEYESEFLED